MAKSSRKVEDLFVPAELSAAQDMGIRLTSEYVLDLRTKLKAKAHQVKESVQYYALLVDKVWDEEETDDRIFAAVRLLHEYHGPSGKQIADKEERIEALSDLILRLAGEKRADLPIIRKIKAGAFSARPQPLDHY